MDYQQTCIQKQKHLTNIYFYQNLSQLYIMAPITTVRGPFGFNWKRDCTICVTKTKVLISLKFTVTASWSVPAFVFEYADCWFSYAAALILIVMLFIFTRHSDDLSVGYRHHKLYSAQLSEVAVVYRYHSS